MAKVIALTRPEKKPDALATHRERERLRVQFNERRDGNLDVFDFVFGLMYR